jgi:hypothetical protein
MWRQVACSHECYIEYIQNIEIGRRDGATPISLPSEKWGEQLYKLRGYTKGTRTAYDIDNYSVNGNSVNIQTKDGTQFGISDFEYFIVSADEMTNILVKQNSKPVQTRPVRNTKLGKSEIVEMAVVEE